MLGGGLISAIIVGLLFTNNILSVNEVQSHDDSAEAKETQAATDQTDETDQIKTVKSEAETLTIDDVSKAVVGVSNRQQPDIWNDSQETGAGSGIIYKQENGKAYVITNNHVVDGANEVVVTVNEQDQRPATVLGTDALSDLALLEIDGEKIDTVAKLGKSKDLNVGETVYAIGNPISIDFSGSVTKGIISGLNRPVKIDTTGNRQPDWVMEVIQTDAAINPGNSGGALVNSAGEVVGINSMKIAQQSVEGIGFAIPIDAALPLIEQLEEQGEVERPFIGISMVELPQVPEQYRHKVIVPNDLEGGVVIANVEANSPAEKAEIQQFDVITKINGEPITSVLDLRKYMYTETMIDETIQIELYREGKIVKTSLELVKSENQ